MGESMHGDVLLHDKKIKQGYEAADHDKPNSNIASHYERFVNG